MDEDVADLAAWIEHRDDVAFTRLVQRHVAMVTGICRRRLAGGLADEAVQAVFILLADRADSIANRRSLSAWLHGVAVRVCNNAQRGLARRARHERQAARMQDPATGPDADPAWQDLRPYLDEAIAVLSTPQQEVVVGHFLEGLTQSALAKRLGISEEATHQRIHYALGKLRTWFGKRGMAVSAGALAVGMGGEAAAAEPTLVTACTQAAVHPASAPAASALAGGVMAPGHSMLAVAGLAIASLVVVGGVVAWRTWTPSPPIVVEPGDTPAAGQERVVLQAASAESGVLLAETFEDDAFRSRGWYDAPQFIVTSVQPAPDSRRASEFLFRPDAESVHPAGPRRRLFPPAEGIRMAYWIRYDAGWESQGSTILFRILTTADGAWDPPSYTHLTCAIGVLQGVPFVALQDALNIDAGRVGQDLAAVTEARAVAGGNGEGDGHGAGNWFTREDGRLGNWKPYPVIEAAMTDHPGPFFPTTWHRIEVRLHLNRIVDGKAVADGRLAYLVDGRTILDLHDVLYRTAQHPDMRFNQLFFNPESARMSKEQSIWIDDLRIIPDPATTVR